MSRENGSNRVTVSSGSVSATFDSLDDFRDHADRAMVALKGASVVTATPTTTGNHVIYALETLGHHELAEAMGDFGRAANQAGYAVEPKLAVKADAIAVSLTIKPAEGSELPLFAGEE